MGQETLVSWEKLRKIEEKLDQLSKSKSRMGIKITTLTRSIHQLDEQMAFRVESIMELRADIDQLTHDIQRKYAFFWIPLVVGFIGGISGTFAAFYF